MDSQSLLAIALAAALLGWLGAWISVDRELRRFGRTL
jgi:cell division protein FtsX